MFEKTWGGEGGPIKFDKKSEINAGGCRVERRSDERRVSRDGIRRVPPSAGGVEVRRNTLAQT